MAEKPKIQYVGQFYIHGSEAPKLEPKKEQKKAKTRLPLERLRKVEKVYLDPVAVFAIVVAFVMLATMIIGTLQIVQDWQDYQVASAYVDKLHQDNAIIEWKYVNSFDKEEIRAKAVALGMIPLEEAATKTVTITYPEAEPEVNPVVEWIGHVRWFWQGLWA